MGTGTVFLILSAISGVLILFIAMNRRQANPGLIIYLKELLPSIIFQLILPGIIYKTNADLRNYVWREIRDSVHSLVE